MDVRSGVFWYGMEGFVSIFRRFSLSIGCTLRLVVMCVSLLGLTSCFVGKYAFEMSRNYRPVYNPGGHLFEEDEDFARSYELYKKRREDLQNSGDSAAHNEQKKKRLTEAEKRKVVGRLRRHGVKVAAVDDNKGDMVNKEGIDLSRVKGARFIDIDPDEIAKLKAKGRTKAGATEADQQNIEEKGADEQKELLEEGAELQPREEGVSEQEAGANAADKDGQQQENVDELEPGTVGDEGEDFFESEEDEDRQDADISGLEPGSATADNKSTADDEGEDFLGEDGDQQYADGNVLEPSTADNEGTVGGVGGDFIQSEEEDAGQPYEDISGLEPGGATADDESAADNEGEDFLSGEEDKDQQYADEDGLESSTADDEGTVGDGGGDLLKSEEEDADQQHEDVSRLEQDSGSIERVVGTGADASSTLTNESGKDSRGSRDYFGSYSSACYSSGTGGGFYFSIDDECCDVDGGANCDSDEGYIFGHR